MGTPVREAAHPSITRLGIGKHTLERHLDVYPRAGWAWQSDLRELLLQICRDHVRPLDAVLSGVVGTLVSQPRLMMHN